MSSRIRISAACALLIGTLLCATVLAWTGVLSKSEILPILGGIVVVAHRLLENSLRPQQPTLPKSQGSIPKSYPPDSAGVGVVFGMAAGSAAATLANLV